MTRAVRLAELTRDLGWWSLPAQAGERWRARYVGRAGQVVAVYSRGRLELRLTRHARPSSLDEPATVLIGRDVPLPAAETLLRTAMSEVDRRWATNQAADP